MIIAVDATGGEYAPHEIVKGAIKAAREYEVEIALVGRKEILYVLAGRHAQKLGIKIIDAGQVIEPQESPIEAVRNKPDSSIVIGTNLVKDGSASAFVSAGNTGAVLYSALANLGKIEGIERPAIGCLIGINTTAPVLLIDAGANAECRPKHLVQFARLGTTYIREIFDISSPTVGLLNNGEEEKKGGLSHGYQPEQGCRHQGEADDENGPVTDPVPEAAQQDLPEDACDTYRSNKVGRRGGGFPQIRGMGGDMYYDGQDGEAEAEEHPEQGPELTHLEGLFQGINPVFRNWSGNVLVMTIGLLPDLCGIPTQKLGSDDDKQEDGKAQYNV